MDQKKNIVRGVALATLLVVATVHAEDSAEDLWTYMCDGGLITQEQCDYAQENGNLPTGSTATNSPIPKAEQANWMRLTEHNVITSSELAYILMDGNIPHLTALENQALAELAPVYEANRAKRLQYGLRRKHLRVDMIRTKYRAKQKWELGHAAALEWAEENGISNRWETADGQIVELMTLDESGHPLFNTTFNTTAAETMSTDLVKPGGSTGFNLTGSNVTVGVWDGGNAQELHQEFEGRLQNKDNHPFHPHPTGVAGTIAAAGIDANAQGMATEVNVDAYYWDEIISEMSDGVQSNANFHLSNHSYGYLAGWYLNQGNPYDPWWRGDVAYSETEDWQFGFYNTDSRDMDAFVYDSMYHLPVYASGNDRHEDISHPTFSYVYLDSSSGTLLGYRVYYSDVPRPVDGGADGYDTISQRGISKNILTVGAIGDLPGGYTNGATVSLAYNGARYFSSCGPTDDGRIKPDISANGEAVYTTYTTTSNEYASVNGTSFAAPAVTGSLALLQQWHELIYGTNAPMLASTMKALVLHTADDVGNPGPDYRFGWGLMNTERAAWAVTNNASWDSLPHIKEVSLNDGEMVEFDIQAVTGTPLKVTIVWTDPEGPVPPSSCDPTNRMLINDLDLRVFSTDGSTNFPWVLDGANPSSNAVAGDNVLDNVEQICVDAPAAGTYTVQVSHKGTLTNGVQDVSILVSGNTPTNAPDFVITDIGATAQGEPIQLDWPGVVGALYEIETSTNLVSTGNWESTGETVSANAERMEWLDADSTNHPVRFYRLKRLK